MNRSNIEKRKPHVKQNTVRNTTSTFLASLCGASVVLLIEIFIFEGSVNPLQQILMVFFIAIGVTLVFMLFRYLFHKKRD